MQRYLNILNELYIKYSQYINSIYNYGSYNYPFIRDKQRDKDYLILFKTHNLPEELFNDIKKIEQENRTLCLCRDYLDTLNEIKLKPTDFHLSYIYELLNQSEPLFGEKYIFKINTDAKLRLEYVFLQYVRLRFDTSGVAGFKSLKNKQYYYLAAELFYIRHKNLNFTEEEMNFVQKAHDCLWTEDDLHLFRDLLLHTMQQNGVEL